MLRDEREGESLASEGDEDEDFQRFEAASRQSGAPQPRSEMSDTFGESDARCEGLRRAPSTRGLENGRRQHPFPMRGRFISCATWPSVRLRAPESGLHRRGFT